VQHHAQLFSTGSLGNADPNPVGQKDLDTAYAVGCASLPDFHKPPGAAFVQLMLPVLKGVAG
jgi:hypothetical protein